MTAAPQETEGGGQSDAIPGVGLNDTRLAKVLARGEGEYEFALTTLDSYPGLSEEQHAAQQAKFINSIDSCAEGLGVIADDWPDLFLDGHIKNSYGTVDTIEYPHLMRAAQAGKTIGMVFHRLGWDTLPMEMCEDGSTHVWMAFTAANERVLIIDLEGDFDEVRTEPDYEFVGYRVGLRVVGTIVTTEKYDSKIAATQEDIEPDFDFPDDTIDS